MKRMDLLNDDLKKIFIRYLIPGILSSLAISLYIFVDTMFVGIGVGRDGLTALNVTVPLFTLFTSINLCVGIGGSNILSLNKASGGKDSNKIFTIAFLFTIMIGIIISVLGVVFTDQIGKVLGATSDISYLFRDYFRILVGFTWAFLISGVLGCFIRNDGAPKLVMTATVVANITNVVLDYIFIFEWNLGIKGAVIATVISPIVNILILITYFFKKNSNIKLCKVRFDFRLLSRILNNGFGTFLLEMSRGISIFIFNNILVRLGGNIYVASYGIILNVSYVIICIFSGIAQSIQPIVSMNYGHNSIKRTKTVFRYGFITSIFIGVSSFLIALMFSENISSLFINNDFELLSITIYGMKIYFIGCIFMAFNIVTIYFFQSINQSQKSILISLCSGILFIILGFLILIPILKINGVWFVYPFSEFLGCIVCLLIIKRTNIENKKELIL